MTDMRDFNTPPGEIISEDVRPVNFSEPRNAYSDDRILNETDEGLGEFHVVESEESSNTGRIVGALAVALLLGTAGIYAYESSSRTATPAATSNQVASTGPAPSAPANTAPASSTATNMTPAQSAPDQTPAAQAPASEPASMPAPAKSSRSVIRAARNDSAAVQTPEVTPAQIAPTPGLPNQAAPVQMGQAQATTPNPALANNVPSDNSAVDMTTPSEQATPAQSDSAVPTVQPAPLQPTPVQPDQAAAQPAPQ